MWDKVAYCESGGNWAINLGSGYYGGLQMLGSDVAQLRRHRVRRRPPTRRAASSRSSSPSASSTTSAWALAGCTELGLRWSRDEVRANARVPRLDRVAVQPQAQGRRLMPLMNGLSGRPGSPVMRRSGHPAAQLVEHHGDLAAGEVGAEAEVRAAGAEADLGRRDRAGDVERGTGPANIRSSRLAEL